MASVVHGYYGKLPVSAEFLRLHAAGPELRWLDDWLQRGVLYAKSREGSQWSTLVTQSNVWKFLYAPAGHGRMVCGALCMSQDKAGRSFPFLTFFLLDDKDLFKHLAVVPLMVATGLDELAIFLEGLRASLDWPEFCRKLDGVQNPALNVSAAIEGFDHYLRIAKVKSFWPDREENDSRSRLFGQGFLHAIDSAKRSGNGSLSWGLKCPLATEMMKEPYDVSFWIAVMTRVITRRDQASGLMVFWNRNPTTAASCAMASRGPGSPNIVRFLVSPNAQDDSWHDIQKEPSPETRPDVRLGRIDNPDATLQQLLDYIATIA
jgi:type VI secretion system protein ImpM